MPWPQPAVLRNTLRSSSSTSKDDDGEGKESKKYRVLALYKFVSPLLPTSSLPEMKFLETNAKSQVKAPMLKPVLSLFIQKFHFRSFENLKK